MTDLLVLALEGCPDVLSAEQSVRLATLERAKNIIRKRLPEPDLTLGKVARQTGVSLSYLHQLFRADGQTMCEYLKSQRLQRARLLLESPVARRMSISGIFLECGFTDKSYFSRAFKQRFGLTLSDVTSRALGGADKARHRLRTQPNAAAANLEACEDLGESQLPL